MKKLILAICILATGLTGCAGQTPLQGLSGIMDHLKDNMLSDALAIDAKTTLEDVESWKGQISETDYLGAMSCAGFIVAAHAEKTAIIEEIQELVLSADTKFTGLASGEQSPMIIRRLTAAKYAPQGAEGASIGPRIKELEARVIKLVSGARNACMNLIDDQLLIKLGIKAFGL